MAVASVWTSLLTRVMYFHVAVYRHIQLFMFVCVVDVFSLFFHREHNICIFNITTARTTRAEFINSNNNIKETMHSAHANDFPYFQTIHHTSVTRSACFLKCLSLLPLSCSRMQKPPSALLKTIFQFIVQRFE